MFLVKQATQVERKNKKITTKKKKISDKNNIQNTTTDIETTRKNKNKNNTKSDKKDNYCYASCKMGRRFDNKMIRCCSCMKLIHTVCADLNDSHESRSYLELPPM